MWNPFKKPVQANAIEPLTFNATVEIQAKDGDKKPRINVLAYNGGVMAVPGWGKVLIDLAGLSMPETVPLLADHEANLDGIIGQGTPSKTGGKLSVSGQLSNATEAGKTVLQLSKDGFVFQASVGVDPSKRKYVSSGESVQVNGQSFEADEDGFYLIESGSLKEVSIVPLGADNQTAVNIAAKHNPEGKPMPTTIEVERERIGTINAMLKPPSGGWGMVADQVEEIRASAITGEITLADLPAKVRDLTELQTMRASREVPTFASGAYLHSANRTPDARILEASVAGYVGLNVPKLYGEQAAEAGSRLGITCLMDAVRIAAKLSGREPDWRNKDEVIKAAFSTRDLPDLLSNVANKSLQEAYGSFPSAAKMVAKKLDANDFKTHTGVRLTGDVIFEKTPGDGEIRHGTLTDDSFTYAIDTYAKMYGISRQDLINDDTNGLSTIPQRMGRGAALAVEEVFWTLVLANTGNFFHTNNKNALTAALDATALGSAVQKFMEQVDQDSKPINAVPKYLCVPPALKVTADELYASRTFNVGAGSASDKVPAANAFFGMYEPVVSPWIGANGLTGGTDTQWYLFGDAQDIAAFGIAYLGGIEFPTIQEVDMPANKLGIQLRGFLDFGVCQVDHRGGVRSTGAG